jgi:hypothetical protein
MYAANLVHMFATESLPDICEKVADVDVAAMDVDEVAALARGFAAARAGLDAAEARWLGGLETSGVCDRFGLKTASWVAHETHADRRSVQARVQVGVALAHRFTAVDVALRAGRVTFDHARAFVTVSNPRVVDQIADLQEVLIERAQDRPFHIWRSELVLLVELLDADGPFDPNRDLARNRLHITEVTPGEILFSGTLVGERALRFVDAIKAESDRLWRQLMADHAECPDVAMPTRATVDAMALDNITRRGHARRDTPGRAPIVDITLIMRADQPAAVYTLDGDRLSADRYRHLFCDAAYTAVTVDRVGVPLGMGRTVRYATPGQRRALVVRDGGCVFPGCDAPASWCDAHHVDHWEHDGPTDLDNLALLCRHHHSVTHRTGWHMTATPDQHFQWVTPGGHTLHSQRHRGRPHDP